MDCTAEATRLAEQYGIGQEELRKAILLVSGMMHIPIHEAICDFVAVMNWPEAKGEAHVRTNRGNGRQCI